MATITRTDLAANACVRSALRGPKTPLAALATSLDALRDDPSWNKRDVEQVRAKAFRRLTRPTRRDYSRLEPACC